MIFNFRTYISSLSVVQPDTKTSTLRFNYDLIEKEPENLYVLSLPLVIVVTGEKADVPKVVSIRAYRKDI